MENYGVIFRGCYYVVRTTIKQCDFNDVKKQNPDQEILICSNETGRRYWARIEDLYLYQKIRRL